MKNYTLASTKTHKYEEALIAKSGQRMRWILLPALWAAGIFAPGLTQAAMGPLKVHPTNRRCVADTNGTAVY